ncbi:MAG: exonuclease SbcCD subunit D [Wujia sp.]
MRFAHTGDLHIGKRLHERSLLEDQREILQQILGILKDEAVDALIIAGDIYDKPTPGTEAVRLFDDFVYAVEQLGIRLIAISGNHDSMERISFGSRIMRDKGVYFQENFDGCAQRLSLTDDYGEINVYMVPFIKPAYVNAESYEDAFAGILARTDIDYGKRNILVAHQFVTGTHVGEKTPVSGDAEAMAELAGKLPVRAESESVHVGGLDNISYELIKNFDYVALGHLHRRQSIGEAYIRYAGSPLKYSFSEGNDTKSIEIVDIQEKGTCVVRQHDLEMPRELRTIRGTLEHLTSEEVVGAADAEGVSREDYICAVITDKQRVVDAAARLQRWYPNLLRIEYQLDKGEHAVRRMEQIQGRSPVQLFEEYYEMMNGKPIGESKRKVIEDILGGGANEADQAGD